MLKTNYTRADSFNGLRYCHVNFCICTSFTCVMANIFPNDVWWPKKTVKVMHDKISLMHLSMVCPRMGGGGNPPEIWHFQVFKCQFPYPWVSILSQIPTPGANLYRHSQHSTEHLQSVFFLGDEIMVPTISNFEQSVSVEDIFCWIFSVAGNLTHILYSQFKYLWIFSDSIYSNVQCQNMTCHHHLRRVMTNKRAGVCNCGPVWIFDLFIITKICGRGASGENKYCVAWKLIFAGPNFCEFCGLTSIRKN